MRTVFVWLPLMDALRMLDFAVTDAEALHKLLQSAEAKITYRSEIDSSSPFRSSR